MRESPIAVGDGGRGSDNAALAGLLRQPRPVYEGYRGDSGEFTNRFVGFGKLDMWTTDTHDAGCRTRCSVRVRTC